MTSPSFFYVIFRGNTITIRTGFGQFYDSSDGMVKLITEMEEMKKFPFRVDVAQNGFTGDISYTLYIESHGIEHKVIITYDPDHPQYQMDAFVEYPRLNWSRTFGHVYSENRPCYVNFWNRSWKALKVATQLRFWLHDYYEGNLWRPKYAGVMNQS